MKAGNDLDEISWPPRLGTDRIVLRQIKFRDAESLFKFRSDPEVQVFNGGVMLGVDDAIELIRKLEEQAESKAGLHWGLTVYPDDVVVGLFGLANWSAIDRRAELGYSMAKEYWGLGIAHEACQELIRFGFERLGLNKLHACPLIQNNRSIALIERLGFKLEGVFREHFFLQGTYYDEGQYALFVGDYLKGNS